MTERTSWYVLTCYPGVEAQTRRSLEQRIEQMGVKKWVSDIMIPTKKGLLLSDLRGSSIENNIFPGQMGFVLVCMRFSDRAWSVVSNAPGITGFVGAGNQPTAYTIHNALDMVDHLAVPAF